MVVGAAVSSLPPPIAISLSLSRHNLAGHEASSLVCMLACALVTGSFVLRLFFFFFFISASFLPPLTLLAFGLFCLVVASGVCLLGCWTALGRRRLFRRRRSSASVLFVR